jgi:hypothetical protein
MSSSWCSLRLFLPESSTGLPSVLSFAAMLPPPPGPAQLPSMAAGSGTAAWRRLRVFVHHPSQARECCFALRKPNGLRPFTWQREY